MKNRRLIFSLFYEDGYFVQSRNFRRQAVGDIEWLRSNYGFSQIASAVDELMIFDISGSISKRSRDIFYRDAATLGEQFFAPIAIGGSIATMDDALAALRIGAEKVIVNSALTTNPVGVSEICEALGSQAVVASVDIRYTAQMYSAFTNHGKELVSTPLTNYLSSILHLGVGELLLNSIDQDGTGMGFDLQLPGLVPKLCDVPIILMGGAGTIEHLSQGLSHPEVDGVATGNLFNFIGDGLPTARRRLIADGHPLANFQSVDIPVPKP
jgi:cyclase